MSKVNDDDFSATIRGSDSCQQQKKRNLSQVLSKLITMLLTNHHVVSKYLNIFNSFNRFEVSEVNADSSEDISGLRLLMATFRQLRNPIQVLLIPITMWSGFEQGFFVADFTAVGL